MKKVFSIIAGILSGILLFVFIVACAENYIVYNQTVYTVPFDAGMAIYAMLLLVPSVILGTAAFILANRVIPLYIAAGVLTLATIPSWLSITTMQFVSGLPLLICLSCVICGILITKYRTKPLFICSGAFLVVFLIIAFIAASPWRGGRLLPVLAIFAIPALDSVSFGFAGCFYLLGKPMQMFVLAALLTVAAVLPFIVGALGLVFGVPTILCAAVCVALGVLSIRERTNNKTRREL